MPAPPPPSALPRLWEVPETIRARLGAEAGPQRAIVEDGHLLLILHQPAPPGSTERKAALFWRQPTGAWLASEGRGTGATLLDTFLGTYAARLQDLEAREAKATSAVDYRTLLEELAPLLRSTRGLHRATQQARELVPEERALIDARDRSAALERTAELLLQDAQFGLDFIAARQAEAHAEHARQMAVAAHRFNVLAAVFLPLTALASVLAMEVHAGLPDTPLMWWVILGAGTTLGLALALWITRRT